MTTKRTPPGSLVPRNPMCPLCYDEVSCDGDTFWCEPCGAQWPCEDPGFNDPGGWRDDEAAQCGGIKQPFLTSKYDNIRHDEIRCLLDQGHETDHIGADGITWHRQDENGKPVRLTKDPWAA